MVITIVILYFLVKPLNSSPDIHTYAVPIGGNVTLSDFTNDITHYILGTWYFTSSLGMCQIDISDNDRHRKLCNIFYAQKECETLTLWSACKLAIQHSCNMTTLTIYNVKHYTPKDYTLKKRHRNSTETTQYYRIQLVLPTTQIPKTNTVIFPPPENPGALTSANSSYTTTIIVTGVLSILLVILVLMYCYKNKSPSQHEHWYKTLF
ncbi:elongated Cy06 [Cynomolgus cytomegalovirus]|nr:elongated Cy06 [Cynomolgus cytomegalovirus]